MKKLFTLLFILFVYCSANAQNLTTISGVITSTKSQPVAGATVTLLNTSFSAVTNSAGKYTIKGIHAGKYTLHISCISYAATNQLITLNGQQQTVNIQLNDTKNQLDEVVVTAQKREEEVQQVPISISTLSAKDVQAYRLQNLKDITAVVPNLYSAGPGDNRNVTG